MTALVRSTAGEDRNPPSGPEVNMSFGPIGLRSDSSDLHASVDRDVLTQHLGAEALELRIREFVPPPAWTARGARIAGDGNSQAQLLGQLPDVGEALHLGAIQMRGWAHGSRPQPEELRVRPPAESAAEDPESRGGLAHRVLAVREGQEPGPETSDGLLAAQSLGGARGVTRRGHGGPSARGWLPRAPGCRSDSSRRSRSARASRRRSTA